MAKSDKLSFTHLSRIQQRFQRKAVATIAAATALHKSQILVSKRTNIRCNHRQPACGYAEPRCERRGVLIDRGRGQPAAFGRYVVGTAELLHREGAVHGTAFDCAAHNHVMIAPGVVGAAAGCGFEGAAKVGQRERGDVVGDA